MWSVKNILIIAIEPQATVGVSKEIEYLQGGQLRTLGNTATKVSQYWSVFRGHKHTCCCRRPQVVVGVSKEINYLQGGQFVYNVLSM